MEGKHVIQKKNFKFISDDKNILNTLNREYRNYRITKFHFQILTPERGHVLNRELNYITTVRKDWTPIKRILTLLVLKHGPRWYYKYVDTFPIKVLELEIQPINSRKEKK
jgi:hypothetical protein